MPKPPDLDANGQPVQAGSGGKPPDLDASGKPVPMATREAHLGPDSDWIDTAASTLPYVGGIAGGILGGGLASLPLAFLGGAGGRGLEKTISTLRHGITTNAPRSVKDDALDVAGAGGEQMAYEAGGMMTAPITSRLITKPLLRMAISAPRVLKEFPHTIDTMAQERIPVGSILPRWMGSRGVPGAERAAMARSASSKVEDQLTKEVEALGVTTQPNTLLQSSTGTGARLADAPFADRAVGNVSKAQEEFTRAHSVPVQTPGAPVHTGTIDAQGNPIMRTPMTTTQVPRPITPTRLANMKQIAQHEGDAVLRAEKEGQFVPDVDRASGQFNRDLARDARATIANYPAPYGRQLDQQMTRTQKLIGLADALKETEGKKFDFRPWEARNLTSILGGSAIGGLTGTWDDPKSMIAEILAARMLFSPRGLSRIGHLASNPRVIANTGRAIGGGFRAATADESSY